MARWASTERQNAGVTIMGVRGYRGGGRPYASSWKGSLAHDRLLFIGRSGGLAPYPGGLVDMDIGAKVARPWRAEGGLSCG